MPTMDNNMPIGPVTSVAVESGQPTYGAGYIGLLIGGLPLAIVAQTMTTQVIIPTPCALTADPTKLYGGFPAVTVAST